jgi:hypothetical protein
MAQEIQLQHRHAAAVAARHHQSHHHHHHHSNNSSDNDGKHTCTASVAAAVPVFWSVTLAVHRALLLPLPLPPPSAVVAGATVSEMYVKLV